MCGIIGYIGESEAVPVLIDGLRRLEYRGYDSAGVAVLGKKGTEIRRAEGKLARLEELLNKEPVSGNIGIGHTRWATHGRPSETNAHPHSSGDIALVHNGIIENYIELRNFLIKEGFKFTSETDTEVVCHLINYFTRKGDKTLGAVRDAVAKLKGSYSLVIMNAKDPSTLYAVKRGSPLVLGLAKGEAFVASDIPALLPYTKDMIFMEDGDVAVIDREKIDLFDENGKKIDRRPEHIPWTPLMAERGGYKHFMLKEIFEQPRVVEDAMTGRLDKTRGKVVLNELDGLFDGATPKFDKIAIVACGTSWHAGMVGKYIIESITKIPVSVDLASEFRYRDPLIDGRTLVVPISQSGETADTLAAETMSKKMGAKVLAVCNVVASSIARHADATVYLHAGPEIGVASTKAFTAQIVVLYLAALNMAERMGKINEKDEAELISELVRAPRHIKDILNNAESIRKMAEKVADAPHFLFIGRGANFPVALEGALKLKEISYVHAEGFAAGELKHGPIALIDNDIPVVAIAPRDELFEKLLSNVEEVKARGAFVIALAEEGDKIVKEKAAEVIVIPKASKFLTPLFAAVPLQLFAYYIADHKGTDVDQPRNLAKSVTVE